MSAARLFSSETCARFTEANNPCCQRVKIIPVTTTSRDKLHFEHMIQQRICSGLRFLKLRYAHTERSEDLIFLRSVHLCIFVHISGQGKSSGVQFLESNQISNTL